MSGGTERLRGLVAHWKSESKRVKELADKERSKSGRESLMAQSVRYWMCADELEAALDDSPAPTEHTHYAMSGMLKTLGHWVCECGEDLGDAPIDEIDAIFAAHQRESAAPAPSSEMTADQMLESVIASLRGYPDHGGDTRVMTEVDRIVAEALNKK